MSAVVGVGVMRRRGRDVEPERARARFEGVYTHVDGTKHFLCMTCEITDDGLLLPLPEHSCVPPPLEFQVARPRFRLTNPSISTNTEARWSGVSSAKSA